MPLISGRLLSIFNSSSVNIVGLSASNINGTNYNYYDIIMTIIEYNKIINGLYDFKNDFLYYSKLLNIIKS